ncbi:hypothetical protein GCM10007377_15140 [Galliscardovia ingluviei]|uniref:Uncharacterized protein n=1 Tax=Galliscardovia ingluviei TaxID=1769422 RepID=A0A8J3F0A3_9BIFI|nr:hypothetical protein [Galliscardovia ingluviei]GGI15286.1 hypothetical protein GCM10007377_15140 [Galliscardovia ingluviei]
MLYTHYARLAQAVREASLSQTRLETMLTYFQNLQRYQPDVIDIDVDTGEEEPDF